MYYPIRVSLIVQANSEKTGWLEDSHTDPESLTSTMMLLMLESCWSKGFMRDFPATQNESNHSAPAEETVAPPSSISKRARRADVELITSVIDVFFKD